MIFLCFLSNLTTSILTLVSLIKTFGEFSGYKVNNSKFTILFLNKYERQNSEILSPFSVVQEGFMYLGIKIVPEIENIVSLNYDPVQSVTESIHRWMPMHISILGRISILKISILAKVLYLFQCIPLPPPQTFFCNIRKLFSNNSGTTDVQDSKSPCCICLTREGGFKYLTYNGITGQRSCAQPCFTFRPLNLLHG